MAAIWLDGDVMEFIYVIVAVITALFFKALPFILAIAVLYVIYKLAALILKGIGAFFSWLTGGV